jgi:hypothetical protein
MAVLALVAVLLGTYKAGRRAEELARPRPTLVQITRAGTRYHRADCPHLANGSTSVDLAEVRGRYRACLVCRPPRQ